MRDRVHKSLEHGTLTELGPFDTRRRLARADQHVPAHEVQGFGYLLVERPTDIARIRLVFDVGSLPCVADRLHVCMRQPPLRFTGAEQNTGQSQPRSAAIVVRHDSELARRGLGDPFLSEVFSQEPTRQRVVQITRLLRNMTTPGPRRGRGELLGRSIPNVQRHGNFVVCTHGAAEAVLPSVSGS